MMIIVKANDVSHFELEEMSEGKLRVYFKDGVTKAEAQTIVDIRDYPSVANYIFLSNVMMEDLRKGTPQPNGVK